MKTLKEILLVIATVLFVGLFISLPVMWLWNWLIPDIFGLIEITFFQALGLTLLCNFLFKSSINEKN